MLGSCSYHSVIRKYQQPNKGEARGSTGTVQSEVTEAAVYSSFYNYPWINELNKTWAANHFLKQKMTVFSNLFTREMDKVLCVVSLPCMTAELLELSVSGIMGWVFLWGSCQVRHQMCSSPAKFLQAHIKWCITSCKIPSFLLLCCQNKRYQNPEKENPTKQRVKYKYTKHTVK